MSGTAIGDITFLDEATVKRHLDHDARIEAMERAFVDFSSDRVIQPARQLMPVEPYGGSVGWNTREGRPPRSAGSYR